MNSSSKRKLAMLAAEDGELAEADKDLTSIIDSMKNKLSSISDESLLEELSRCLLDRAAVRSWAVKLPEALNDLEHAEEFADQLKSFTRRTLKINILQSKADIFSTPFSNLFDLKKSRMTIDTLRKEKPEEWIAAVCEIPLAQNQQDWKRVIHLADIIIKTLDTQGWVRGVNAIRNTAARAWLELGEFKKAEPLAEAAVSFFEQQGPPDIIAQAELALARARGEDSDWKLVEKALSRIEELIRMQRTLFGQQRYLVNKMQVYNDAIRFALYLKDKATTDLNCQNAIKRAWEVAERSKSFSLRHAMTQGGWLQELDPDFANKLVEMEEKLDALEAQIQKSKSAEESFNALSKQRIRLIEEAMASKPFITNVYASSFTLQTLFDKFPKTVGIISWYWLMSRDHRDLHIFYSGANRIPEHIKTAWSEAEIEELKEVRKNFKGKLQLKFLSISMSEKIFPPKLIKKLAGCDTLLLSPHKYLQQMPLHMTYINNSIGDTVKPNMLIELFAVQVIPTLALPLPDNDTKLKSWRVLLMGCSQDGYNHKSLDEVPQELNNLKNIWIEAGHKASSHSLSSKDRLNEYVPLSKWEQFELIHLACHGSFVPNRPLDAALYLGRETVRASEFFKIKLNAKVISLSACDVAQHADILEDLKLVSDEWLGLALPLFQSGARAVLSSLWQANDEIARSFMEEFHRILAQGESAARAFQLTCMKQNKKISGLWANWQLTGFPNM